MEYTNQIQLSYKYKGKTIQFSILVKELTKEEKHTLYTRIDELFDEYKVFINENKSEKVSKNNIIKFFNQNGVDCVNREYYKGKVINGKRL